MSEATPTAYQILLVKCLGNSQLHLPLKNTKIKKNKIKKKILYWMKDYAISLLEKDDQTARCK